MKLDEKNIILKKISKKVYFNKETLNILNEINLTINQKEFIVIMGPSGSGKSTLLNIIGLLDLPSSGEIIWNGTNISELNQNDLAEKRNKDIGFIFQQYNLINSLTVKENVFLPLYLNNTLDNNEKNNKVIDVLTKVGMKHRMDNFPSTLSGGEQQRVAIARAIVNNPSIIIADEPTGNVDSENEHLIIDLLNTLVSEGTTVVVVTHNDIYKKYANNLYYLKNGCITK